jgi:hypothetical protein
MTACLEDQASVPGIGRDLGFICPLTRCRSGLTGTVATRGCYKRAAASALGVCWVGRCLCSASTVGHVLQGWYLF